MHVTQFTLLATLVQTGPIPTTRLADFLGLERTTLTRNLALLVRDGLVQIDEGEDRRVRKVAITPAGEEAARRAYPFWKKAQDAALAAAGGAERTTKNLPNIRVDTLKGGQHVRHPIHR